MQVSMSNAKAVFWRKFSKIPSKLVLKVAVFGEMGGLNVTFCFCQKAHRCEEPRLSTYFASKSARESWVWAIRRTEKEREKTKIVE